MNARDDSGKTGPVRVPFPDHASQAPRILLVEDSAFYRKLLRQLLARAMPAATIEEYDPARSGRPDARFVWEQYDLVLLDYQLGAGTGLDWLRAWHNKPGFPPVILLTGEGSEAVAVKAMKLGAQDYLSKLGLKASRLLDAVREALAARKSAPPPTPPTLAAPDPAVTVPNSWPFVPDDLAAGRARVGDWMVEAVIGSGGLARVFRARHARNGKAAALKVLLPQVMQDDTLVARFIEEYAIAAGLSHANLVRVEDQGFTDAYAYIVMEMLPGGDLARQLRGHGMPAPRAAWLGAQVAAGLAALHDAGIIHRDLKPSNIMFRADHEPVLVDFGVAKRYDDTRLGLTLHNQTVGTPLYMSPEQALANQCSPASDLYSLGVVLYEMLEGRKLFAGPAPAAVMYHHVHTPPDAMQFAEPGLSRVVLRLLAKRPQERYGSAAEVVEALLPYAAG